MSPTDEKLSYSSYLKIEELLLLQKPLSKPVAHDELLFIAIHQVYELWFKVIIFELDDMVAQLRSDNFLKGQRRLERVNEIFRLLVQQIDILETMTPVDFNRFRSHINPASGFQSRQFRELEMLGGIEASEFEKFLTLDPEWANAVKARSSHPNLRVAFFEVLKRHGVLENDTPEAVQKALLAIYQEDERESLRNLCEHLLRFDELVQLWRFRHVQMVERMIGMKPGTGGSLGAAYLKTTLRKRFFPELWEVRTQMGTY